MKDPKASGSSDKKEKTAKETPLDQIKSSVFSRSMALAKMTLKTGVQLAGHSIKNSMSSDKSAAWQDFLKDQAQTLSLELGQLKGSLMKAGQMLSMYGEHFLPPEANQFLKTLQSESPPLKWEPIYETLKKELGDEKLALLEIQTQALASASMGQVHRAKIKATGEEIVLKVQYPRVDEAIDSDLKGIKTILGLLKLLPRDFDPSALFEEVREMLHQETDYELEAENTERFGKLLENDSRFVVPKVYREFSNRKILALSYEKGLRADDSIIQNLSQEKRNKIALNFLDLFFKELYDWKIVQTDPHVGNYQIRLNPFGEDQIILFDFGATRSYGNDFLNHYYDMIRGVLFQDRATFLKGSKALNFIRENDDPELIRLFEEFCFETIEPFIAPDDPRNRQGLVNSDGTYDWKNTDLPQRITAKVLTVVRKNSFRTPPREILFLDRKTGGVFIFLSVLRARICGRDVLLKYVQNTGTP